MGVRIRSTAACHPRLGTHCDSSTLKSMYGTQQHSPHSFQCGQVWNLHINLFQVALMPGPWKKLLGHSLLSTKHLPCSRRGQVRHCIVASRRPCCIAWHRAHTLSRAGSGPEGCDGRGWCVSYVSSPHADSLLCELTFAACVRVGGTLGP